jgi:four helix bundle protein
LPLPPDVSKADDLQTRAEAFADLSIRFVQGLPDHQIARRMGGQYLDASTSVAANYRSARRGKSYADFTAKIGTVSEEADESVFWMKRFSERTHRQQRRRDRTASPGSGGTGPNLRSVGQNGASASKRQQMIRR